MRNELLALLLLFSSAAQAREYRIGSAEELTKLKLNPGDKVILADISWKDQQLLFKGTGTEKQPIILTTEKQGKVKLTGGSRLEIDGTWLVVDGLIFTEGYSPDKDVIRFTSQSSHCRLTNSAIINYNPPDKKMDYKWVSVWGHHNRVDHCWLEGKTHQGTTLVVWLDAKPNYHQIDHNYFGPRPELGVNGGETIRIGNSVWSLYPSFTMVEKNIFDRCNGEIEIISNKSGNNTLRENLFFECAGTLTLRHGNEATVHGNYFIGNGLHRTGGVRIIGENHKVYNNYFQGLAGTGLSAALSVMAGVPNPELNSHWQVKNAHIYNNLIIDCKEGFGIGAGKNIERYLQPLNTSFRNNHFLRTERILVWADTSVQVNFQQNSFWQSPLPIGVTTGFMHQQQKLKKWQNQIFYRKGKAFTPFWARENVGPCWKKKKFIFKIRQTTSFAHHVNE